MSFGAHQPGLPLGAYRERSERAVGALDALSERVARRWAARRSRVLRRRRCFLARVAEGSWDATPLEDERLASWARDLGLVLRRSDFAEEAVTRVLALVGVLAERSLGVRPDDEDLWTARLLLEGVVVERVEAGSGLASALAAAVAALSGVPVHVVHAQDDGARRALERVQPLFAALGLRGGLVTAGAPARERAQAYACEIAYCNHKQLAFDYLRDRILLGREAERGRLLLERLHAPQPRLDQVLLRGLGFAVVEDAVALLVEAARQPLVIGDRAGAAEEERELRLADEVAGELEQGPHFGVDTFEREVVLTAAGRLRIEERTRSQGGAWESRVRREELVRMALFARLLLRRGHDYVVQGERVETGDGPTPVWIRDGRWERGLRRAVEVKEGCPLSVRTEPRGRMSYQRLFRRYGRLSGTAPAACEAGGELGAVYGLAVLGSDPPRLHEVRPPALFVSDAGRWSALGERLAHLSGQRHAVLVFVADEEAASRLRAALEGAGLACGLALRAGEEALAALARRHETGRVTVALGPIERELRSPLGALQAERPLHVVLAQGQGSRATQRELASRGATATAPGSCERWASLEDEVFVSCGWAWLMGLAARRAAGGGRVPDGIARILWEQAQRSCEHRDRQMRSDLAALDDFHAARLAFAGGPDT